MFVSDATDLARPVSISALEFDVLCEHLALTPMPLVLKVASPGRTHSERARLVDAVWRSLSSKDLGDPANLDPDLESMLRVLSRPVREVDGRLWLGRAMRVLAARSDVGVPVLTADGSAPAVLAVKDGEIITLRWVSSAGLAREALSVLPTAPAGPGRSVTLRSSDLDAAARDAGNDVEALTGALRRRGVRAADIETLTTMTGEAGHRGQFGVAIREPGRRRHRGAHVVGYFDSPRGRYVQLRRESPSGDTWSTVAPVDHRSLLGHVEELLAETESAS